MSKRVGLLVGLTVAAVAAAILCPPVPQGEAYHRFADQRALLGVANFADVASNAGFVVAAVLGLAAVAAPRTRFERAAERVPYAFFFSGLLLTAAGSAYYHLAPDNERLYWDRLPMTVAFMSLVATQIVERVSLRAGLALLAPMLLAGAATVQYWIATERAGAGNVVPYGVLQLYAVVVAAVIAWSHPSRYTRARDIYWVFAAYVAAKAFEALDARIFDLGGIVGGHALKHLAAAASGLIVWNMLRRRAPVGA
ncbi:MAG: ceramidase domain-containing protein [Burkholderiales bacterium]